MKIVALLLPVAGASLVFAYLRSFSRDDARTIDLSISELRLDVRPDRRVEVGLKVANRGAATSPPGFLFIQSLAVERRAQLTPLRAGEERAWTWLSSPLEPGDYELVAGIDHQGGILDADESNNVARRLLHIPIEVNAALDGPSVRMPSVVGVSRREAARVLGEAGFAAAQWYERAKRSGVDRIEQQWPEAGARVPRGTKPVLVAAAEATVPNLVGLPFDQVRESLRRNGLVPGPLRVLRSARQARRSVLGQEPEPGARIGFASPVRLVVVEPRPWWPFVAGGSLCLLGLVLGSWVGARGLRDVNHRGAVLASTSRPAFSMESSGARLPAIVEAERPMPDAAAVSMSFAKHDEPHEPKPMALVPTVASHSEAPAPLIDQPVLVATPSPSLSRPLERDMGSGDRWPILSSRVAWPAVVSRRHGPIAPSRSQPAANGVREHRIAFPESLPSDAADKSPVLAIAPRRGNHAIEEMRCVPIWEKGHQQVTWQSETATPVITFLAIRDSGVQAVTWQLYERSTP